MSSRTTMRSKKRIRTKRRNPPIRKRRRKKNQRILRARRWMYLKAGPRVRAGVIAQVIIPATVADMAEVLAGDSEAVSGMDSAQAGQDPAGRVLVARAEEHRAEEHRAEEHRAEEHRAEEHRAQGHQAQALLAHRG
jgi:hypothetical protein